MCQILLDPFPSIWVPPFGAPNLCFPGQQCGADVSELVLRLLDDSDNVMLNGKALNVLAKSSWQRGLQLLQSMVRRKVGARDRWLSDGGHGFLGFTLW